jgi:hypothetical protein
MQYGDADEWGELSKVHEIAFGKTMKDWLRGAKRPACSSLMRFHTGLGFDLRPALSVASGWLMHIAGGPRHGPAH